MKRIFLFHIFICVCILLQANPLSSLKEICPEGKSVKILRSYCVSGIVASDWRSLNMELNPNVSKARVNVDVNDATVYLSSPDGSMGIRILFDEPADNRLCRFDHLTIDLKGATVSRYTEPERIEITGVNRLNVVSVSGGSPSDIPVKEKHISELTDSDIYTYVTLKDMEMIFKDGTYADIYEPYAQHTDEIQGNSFGVSGRMDGWASLLRDGGGNTIYMLVNTLCTWRRNGRGVPQGVGNVSGIIVHTPMRRYGGDMGRYSIRPLDEKDIAIGNRSKSPWTTLAGWQLDGSAGQTLEFEYLGVQGNVWKEGKKGDRVLNDVGKVPGFFWTDSDSFIHIDSDLNALEGAGKGWQKNGAIMFKGPSVGWFGFDASGKANSTSSFFIEFPARKAKGKTLSLSFSWAAGDQDANHDWGFPAEWFVQCSTDGGATWITLKETATGKTSFYLRPLPYWDKVLSNYGNSQSRPTGYDCGLGMQQRSFLLPASAGGSEKVLLRIAPVSARISLIRANPASPCVSDNVLSASSRGLVTYIRFGSLMIDCR